MNSQKDKILEHLGKFIRTISGLPYMISYNATNNELQRIFGIPATIHIPKKIVKAYFKHLQQYDGESLITYTKFFICRGYKPCWHDLIPWSEQSISNKQRLEFNKLIITTGLPAYVFRIRHGNNPQGSNDGGSCNCSDDCNKDYHTGYYSLPECLISKLLQIRQKIQNITPEDFEKDIDDLIDWNVPFVFSDDSFYNTNTDSIKELLQEAYGEIDTDILRRILRKMIQQLSREHRYVLKIYNSENLSEF